MRSRTRALYDKSLASVLAAIEIYNKPDFSYREETFSILAINAWELLLKARILQLDGNRVSAILEYERRRKPNGQLSSKRYRTKNRSGNHVSIGLFKAYDRLVDTYAQDIDPLVRKNLEVLTEIRDNSVHFFNKDLELRKSVLEIGTASLKNYVSLASRWFGADLEKYNFFIMPVAFFRDFHTIEAVPLNTEERKFVEYVRSNQSSTTEDPCSDFALSLMVDLRIKKASGSQATEVRLTNDPGAIAVQLEEEDILDKYPWEFNNLTAYLSNRYSDFKQNRRYHNIRKPLESDKKFCHERLLNPSNPKAGRKRFYNPNIVREFDKHYTKTSASA